MTMIRNFRNEATGEEIDYTELHPHDGWDVGSRYRLCSLQIGETLNGLTYIGDKNVEVWNPRTKRYE